MTLIVEVLNVSQNTFVNHMGHRLTNEHLKKFCSLLSFFGRMFYEIARFALFIAITTVIGFPVSSSLSTYQLNPLLQNKNKINNK